ncbi:methyltransferase domain-containing protein [Rhodopirellula sp. JC740]|uniref:Methyltransferase domain-containing protein n=1 Tax=Rhodopirellula halodulae TaxID=2894198 RepID=A0ABS8NBM6_9BACT|nr:MULTISPECIES: methyltransferase domain-containing protein [unclassified Rhodopirellula]MCC9640958.1 methyltransferase domain-containing protein [Rhodopirellula sp. JC740]MCC9656435.1 methyltransferase domain-containing protein [Rhodopirellula sp. JC737]
MSAESNHTTAPHDHTPGSSGGAWTFLRNFARSPTQVGAIWPSSPGLVRRMVEWFDWESARGVVEFGPGTGVFTEAILASLHQDAKFFAIERSAELASITRRRCPSATVLEESAERVADLCRDQQIEQVDAVICGLPWASFPDSLQDGILNATLDVLAPGGQFATFAYWQGVVLPAGQRFSKKLHQAFPSVHRSPTVWKNMPPAFIYRCTKS